MSGFLGIMFSGGGGGITPPPVTPSEYVSFLGYGTSNAVKAYPWNSTTGYGSIYTSPTTVQQFEQVSFVPDNSTISVSAVTAPYFSVFRWSTLGFGTKYANPASPLSPVGNGAVSYVWSKNVDALLTVNQASVDSRPQAWAWDVVNGFGTKYANGTAITYARSMTLSGDGTLVAFSSSPDNAIHLYPWSSSGFGTKYASLTFSVQLAQRQSLSFNKVTNDIATGATSSPFIFAYSVSSAGFGTQYSTPSTVLPAGTNGLQFSPDGSVVATVNFGYPPVNVYRWGGGFGSKYSYPSFEFIGSQTMDWTSTSNAIGFTSRTQSPYQEVYRWSAAGFGTRYNRPATSVIYATGISFSNKSR